jgi:hypothetical protein
MNWTLYLAIWGAMALGILVLALYRKQIASSENDSLQLSGDGSAIETQKAISAKLKTLDKWGKLLTIVVAVLGLALVGAYGYAGWVNGMKIPA